MIVRLEWDHDDALDWHEWVPTDERPVVRDRIGRRNGGWTWFRRWKCNNPDCPATVLVSDESIARGINDALGRDPWCLWTIHNIDTGAIHSHRDPTVLLEVMVEEGGAWRSAPTEGGEDVHAEIEHRRATSFTDPYPYTEDGEG